MAREWPPIDLERPEKPGPGEPDVLPPDDPVTFLARHSGKALTVPGASKDDGVALVQADRRDTFSQQWALLVDGYGWYRIINKWSGKVLDVAGASLDSGAPVVQWPWHGGHNQQWRVEHVGDGYSRLVARHSGKVLDVAGGALDASAPIVQFGWNGGHNQQWRRLSVPPEEDEFPRH